MPAGPVAVVSCHVERPLDDDAWRRFDALQRRRPGGFDVIALIRPPDPAHGEDEELWLERARAAAARAPVRAAHALDEPDARAADRRRPGRARARRGRLDARARARAGVLLRRRLVHRRRSAGDGARARARRLHASAAGARRPRRATDDAFARPPRARGAAAGCPRTCTRTSTTTTCSMPGASRHCGSRSPCSDGVGDRPTRSGSARLLRAEELHVRHQPRMEATRRPISKRIRTSSKSPSRCASAPGVKSCRCVGSQSAG